MTTTPTNLPYLVVGAGPCGLAAARALKRKGIPFEIADRNKRVGGIWDIEAPGSPMYETCHFITSKINGGFLDYPMPESYPMYPSWKQVHQYIEDMARDYGLTEHIRFSTNITSATPLDDSKAPQWRVETADGHLGDYAGIIYAAGQQWDAYKPQFANMDAYQGRLIHSSEYRYIDEFADKRVLVVGAGNSGVDIAVDAAEHASRAVLSTRRPYYFLPKQLYGIPIPDLMAGLIPFPNLPNVPANLNPFQMVDLVLATVGPLERFGLETPDWPFGATQPIVSDLVLHHFTHGTLTHKPNIAQFTETGVVFDDGTEEEFDVVVLATGFDINIPWLSDDVVDKNDGHPKFLFGTLSEQYETLYAVGVVHPSRANAWTLFDQMSNVIPCDILAREQGINADGMKRLREGYRPDLKGDFPYLETRRNENQADNIALDTMLRTLRVTYGLDIPEAKHDGYYTPTRIAS